MTAGVIGGGVATNLKWISPKVESVVLPVHAETSLESFAVSFNGAPIVVDSNINNESDTFLSQLLDHTIGAARASNSEVTTEIVILPLGGDSYTLQMLVTGDDGNSFAYGYYFGTLVVGASSPTDIPGKQCRVGPSGPPCFDAFNEPLEFQLISVNPGINALISIDGNPPEVVPFVPNPNMLSDPCTTCVPESTL